LDGVVTLIIRAYLPDGASPSATRRRLPGEGAVDLDEREKPPGEGFSE
jgi:hypothetical protein